MPLVRRQNPQATKTRTENKGVCSEIELTMLGNYLEIAPFDGDWKSLQLDFALLNLVPLALVARS
jgi:hypothetical protein